MTLLDSATSSQGQATQILSANLAALKRSQPDLPSWVTDQHLDVEWVLARDGQITALMQDGLWFSGCSLPLRAAEAMLQKLDIKGAVACFLTPSHAAQLRVALQKLRPEQAIIAIVPEMRDLSLMLHCHDFSGEIAAHRLWFAAGAAWEVGLGKLLEAEIGLSTPSQFIRAPDANAEQVEAMISAAQRVFSEMNVARTASMQELARHPARVTRRERLLVIAPQRFRLWNDIGHALLGTFQNQPDIEIVPFDSDDPLCSSPLALLRAARDCGAILTANTARSDLPGLLPETTPWITWVPGARIPSHALAGQDDHLVVIDPAMHQNAVKSGWSAARVHIGTWPQLHSQCAASSSDKHLSIICDTVSTETPKDLIEYSSHALLWETIRHELSRDPFALDRVHPFLNERMRRQSIADEAFAHARFLDKLILPAYQQGLARILIRAKLPVRLYGQGWNFLPEFKANFAGVISSREDLQAAAESSTAVMHVWPDSTAHPVDALPRPIVRRTGRNAETFLHQARAAIQGKIPVATPPFTPLSAQLIRGILGV